ncbi:DUF2953 domain-containing protein [Eubacterium multiforme]|uniref:DUF2953 domain-containing protein n=1 Tax=Eubacterium multiforme TaxID=83339 RepID=A0ABT9US81_9FIRM|nr:DUF2953 domain-containing protein [Eubacterium multiforme]MDQ0149170.1 hypothetical protein [Eubacterium multiforme]
MNLFILLLIIVFLIPVPIKVSIFYSTEDYYIKLYKYKLISKLNKRKENKILHKLKNFINNINKDSFKDNFSLKDFFKILIKNFKNSKFKPTIKINGFLNYSLGDSYNTAIFNGIISSIFPFIYRILNLFFNVKKSKFLINPIFKDSKIITFNYKSIIFVSLGQIIYICIIFTKSILKAKEVSLRENL